MKIDTQYLAITVEDISTSADFYKKLGFSPIEGAGSESEKWMMLENGNGKIGLFEKMFPKNTLTFNSAQVREFYHYAKENGIVTEQVSKSMNEENGPCSFVIIDPDGNPVLFDQHS